MKPTLINNNKKEGVKTMSKKNNSDTVQHSDIDFIYQADAKTRKAIDKLYVRKADRTKQVIIYALIAMIIGMVGGMYISSNMVSVASRTQVVELKVVGETLKAQSQPQNQ